MRIEKPTKPGELIRNARLELDLSLRQLSEQTEISYSALSMFETGKRRIPRKHVSTLCEALRFKLAEKVDFWRVWNAVEDAAILENGSRMDARDAR